MIKRQIKTMKTIHTQTYIFNIHDTQVSQTNFKFITRHVNK